MPSNDFKRGIFLKMTIDVTKKGKNEEMLLEIFRNNKINSLRIQNIKSKIKKLKEEANYVKKNETKIIEIFSEINFLLFEFRKKCKEIKELNNEFHVFIN
jgi:hypothetical protein